MNAALRWALLLAGSAALHAAAFTALHAFGDGPSRPKTLPGALRPDVRVTLAPARAVASAAPVPSAPTERPPETARLGLGGLGRPANRPEAAPLPEIAPLTQAAPLEPIDPTYAYRRSIELTARPTLLSMIELELPRPLGGLAEAPGRLRLRLLISEFGRIDRVIVDESTLAEAAQQFAIERFAAARFRPGELDGRPVPSQITIEVSAPGG